MIKDGIHYCDLCKKKNAVAAHTNCCKCGRDICLKHGKAVRSKERWLGYICDDCMKEEKQKQK